MESVNEGIHLYLAAFLFAAGMGLLLVFSTLSARIYLKTYEGGTKKESILEIDAPVPTEGCILLGRADAAGTVLATGDDVSIYLNGTDLSALTVTVGGRPHPFLAYARTQDTTVLYNRMHEDTYELSYRYDENGQATEIRLTGR